MKARRLCGAALAAVALFFGSCKDKSGPQEPYLTTDPAEVLPLEAGAANGTVTVSTNQPVWNFAVEEGKAWCTASRSGNTLTVQADFNRAEAERTAVITLTAGTQDQNDRVTRTVTVRQAGTVNRAAQLLDRAAYYEKYPTDLTAGTAGKITVASSAIPLYFYGWGSDKDYTFSLDFPAAGTKSFRRAILSYRMGGMNGGPNDWDYTTQIFVRDKTTGGWYELTRAITPYGGSFGATWEKTFYMDVTEYLPMLAGTTEFRIYFDGDWGGPASTGKRHTVTLTFDLYEGEPERNTVWTAKVYDSHENDNTGYRRWGYGFSGENDIEGQKRLGERTFTVPAGVKNIEMKVTFTGYGHDQGRFPDRTGYATRNCAEFDRNTYTVTLNGTSAAYPGIIFVECGGNYSQAGTYNLDRANFCPGNPAIVHYWRLIDVPQDGGQMTLNLDLERFISEFSGPKANDGVASYFIEADLFGFDK
ncbi:BACON domain-containing carbohydrate-binding protein [uncultured Rikenella sp.]|uniref:BACON domain-containing protein n=1 Tax=uncultured Rikenella sp. TaxID=368003 RepID=UPI002623049B|nr:BACON domain-containing carbohydrate-binding protein [uncultured Rikenella sp.]